MLATAARTNAPDIDTETGQMFGANLAIRSKENSCFMLGSTLEVLNLVQSGMSVEGSRALGRLRCLSDHEVEGCVAIHQAVVARIRTAALNINWEEFKPQYTPVSAILHRQDYHLSDRPKQLAQLAGTKVASFADPAQALTAANEFVNKATGGRIPSILDSLDDDSVVVAVTAAVLRGTWKSEFESKYKCKDLFTNAKGEASQLGRRQWLEGTTEFRTTVFADLGVRAVEVPCHGGISVTLFQSVDPTQWQSAYTELAKPAHWHALCDWIYSQAEESKQGMALQVPKFKMDTQTDYLKVFEKHPVIEALRDEKGFNPNWVHGANKPVRLTALVDKHQCKFGKAGFSMAGAAAAVATEESCMQRYGFSTVLFAHPFGFVVSDTVLKVSLGAGFVADVPVAVEKKK